MNPDNQIRTQGSMYLKSATYLPTERKVVLEFTSDPELTIKYSKVVFTNVEEFREDQRKEQPGEVLYEKPVVIKGGNSKSDRKEYFIEIDDRVLIFFSRNNFTTNYY